MLFTMMTQHCRDAIIVRLQSTFKRLKPRIYLAVSFNQKETVKGLGGKWDAVQKKWYIDDMSLLPQVKPWHRVYVSQPSGFQPNNTQKQFYWDAQESKWYTLGYEPVTDISANVSNFNAASSKKESDNIHTDIQKPLDMNSRIIFFDLETNNLPNKANKTNPYDCCRIVQLSYLMCDLGSLKAPLSDDASVERPEAEEAVIRADGFDITNANIHGITLERSMAEGRPFRDVMAQIAPLFKQAHYIVAHNADGFDLPVFRSELQRHGEAELLAHLDSMAVVCTMSRTVGLLKLLNKIGRPKNPTLKELFQFATEGEEIEGQHNAKYDVMNLHRAVRALVRRGIMPLEQLFASSPVAVSAKAADSVATKEGAVAPTAVATHAMAGVSGTVAVATSMDTAAAA